MSGWRRAIESIRGVTSRPMFGATAFFAGRAMFAIAHRGRLYLLTGIRERKALEAEGLGPFRPRSGNVVPSYWQLPPRALRDPDETLARVRRAVAAARRAVRIRDERAPAPRGVRTMTPRPKPRGGR